MTEDDRHLMWIAEAAVKAPLPTDWKEYEVCSFDHFAWPGPCNLLLWLGGVPLCLVATAVQVLDWV